MIHTGNGSKTIFAYEGKVSATYGLAKCARRACGKPFTRKTQNQKYCSTACQRLFHDKPKGTMNFSKVANSPPQQRILHLLKDGIAYTTREIQARARVCNPATWISALNMQGYKIVCKYKAQSNSGARIYTYQIKRSKKGTVLQGAI